jgi:GT2 family glycosyltransferase
MFLAAIYLYKVFPGSRFFGRERMTWWSYDDVKEVETICGCFSLVRSEAIKQVGLMDERYFVYGDDPDWCYRFSKSGWKIMFTPDARIIHYGGQTTKKAADKFKLQLFGSKLIFMRNHRSRPAFILACFLTGMFFLLRVPFWLALAAFRKSDRSRSYLTAKAYLLGGFYCLTNWRRLLMNWPTLQGRL